MLRAHGIESRVNEHHWTTDAEVPPYYSNLVTLSTDDEAQLDRIRELTELRGNWSLKDSYARLQTDLRVLFEAQWFVAEPEGEPELQFVPVRTEAALAHWEQAWQVTSPAPGRRIFPPALLEDADITLHAAMRGPDFVGGVVTNLSPGAVGLSNAFKAEAQDGFVRDCARMAQRNHPDRAVVGYARDPAQFGFRALGPLRVCVSE